MTNFEYWKDKILKINKNDNIAIVKDKLRKCSFLSCDDCDLFLNGKSCRQSFVEWLYSEHVKTPNLTKRERKLCEALGTGWIAADKSGRVFWFDSLPMKGEYSHVIKRGNCICMSDAGFYFEFMDFEDKEPWMVENLLQILENNAINATCTLGCLPPKAKEISSLNKQIEALNMAIIALKEPEIVHCKDCKYWIRTRIGEEELNQCGLAGYLIGGRGYCLYGKAGEQR